MNCLALDRDPGSHPLQKLTSGWVNAKVTYQRTDQSRVTRFEIINVQTKKRYLQEPMEVIAFKSFGLATLVLHVYFFFYAVLNLLRLPIVTLITRSPLICVREIWNIVRFPLYYIGMFFSAVYGIVDPLNGRVLFGEIESVLHDGRNRRQAQTYLKEQIPLPDLLWKFLSEPEHETTFFIGFCMQPIGKTTDPHILEVEVQNSPDV